MMGGYSGYSGYGGGSQSGWGESAITDAVEGPARVRIVTDSASDILPAHARAIGLLVVPSRIVLDGEVYRDGIDITGSQFYARLPHLRTPPSTEPASAEAFYSAYEAAFRQGASAVISIHVSSRVSRIVQNATAAREYFGEAPIYVVDSQQAGIGMWPAVIRAAQLAGLGAPVPVIYEHAMSILGRTRLYALVESLEQLRRNGRIGRAKELLGSVLDSHPIITMEQGEVTPLETVRGRERGMQRLRELVLEAGALETLLICGSSIESIAQVEAVFAPHVPGPIQKTWLGPAIGSNTGPAVAVALVARQ